MDTKVEQKVKPASTSKTSPLVIVALVLGCGALGYSLWNGVETRQHFAASQRQTSEYHEQIAQLSTSLQQQELHLKTLVDNLKSTQEMQTQQQELLTTYTNSLQKVVGKTSADKNDFQLDEVLFLVRNARLHLLWRRDVHSAIALLELGDEQLRRDGNPEWVPIRKSIADDLASLKSVTLPDTDGILAKINALQLSLVKLPLIGSEGIGFSAAAATAPTTPSETHSQPAWRQALTNSLASLQKVVIIRRRETPITPLLAPEQTQLIIGRLQIWMQQAEFGLIQHDEALYRNSLMQAKLWIEAHFDKASTNTQTMLTDLEGLGAIDVSPEFIDITPTQVLIEKAIENRPKHKDESA